MTFTKPPAASVPVRSRLTATSFIAGELGFLVTVHILGGPPWVVLGVLAFLAQILADFRLAPLLRLAPAAIWAVAHAATGNRELFFPYAIYLAAHVAWELWPRGPLQAASGGGGIAAAFLVIRVLQHATPRVIAVELAVAAAILVVVNAAIAASRGRPFVGWVIPPLASLAAYAGLAI
jgi:hypothetical protein